MMRRMWLGPSVTRVRTAVFVALAGAGAARVSRMCRSKLSSLSVTAAMPPLRKPGTGHLPVLLENHEAAHAPLGRFSAV